MSNMPGDYSTYQHNLDNDATMYDGDASTPSAGDPNVGPADMHDPAAAAQTPASTAQPVSTTSTWEKIRRRSGHEPTHSITPNRERQAREAANLRTRTVLREKRDAEARLVAAQREIAALKDRMTADIIERVTAQWNTQVKDYTEKSEQESAARLEAELGALNAEHAKKIAELDREAQKRQLKHVLIGVHSRLSAKRPGFRNPSDEMEDVEFPEGPPARPPQFVSETTRKQRVVETIIRDGSGRLPSACMTTATPPASSSTQPATGAQPPSSSSSAETVDQSLLETLLEALGKPPVQQRVREILGTNGVQKRKRKTKAGGNEFSGLRPTNWYTDRGLPRAKDFFNYEGVSEGSYTQGCEDGLVAPEGPTSKLYFGPGWANSLWNKKIFQHSIRRILQKRAEDPGHYDVPDVKEDYLMALFSNLLREARAGWSRTSRAPEKNERASARACRNVRDGASGKKRRICAQDARKWQSSAYLVSMLIISQKFQVRQETADRMLSISAAKQDGDGIETWTWLKDDLLAELDSGGMSSEEDEDLEVVCGDTRRFTTAHSIKVLPWRDAKVTDCLKVIDDASELAIAKVAAKRMRMRGSRNSTTAPPLGLPRTLYDEAWLAEQKKFIPNIEEALEISEKEFPIKEITLVQSTSQ
ncbi:hypothetical protein B0H14DRAFT_2638851 [Mycena olivaceomarginata]|nr:hypothetical protein B0H14DRAFT_2638851 [Mycena olivaceomarginata]